jgi:septum formation protein
MPTIVLASSSPRRIELLTNAGFRPVVVSPDADEAMLPREAPRSMVARLARDKAEAVAARILAGLVAGIPSDQGTVIIAADTTVVAPDGRKILGKPTSEKDARKMLGVLQGRAHEVFTGYCILKLDPPARGASTRGKKSSSPFRSHILVRVVRTKVKMRALSREAIADYVRSGEPMDKAGAYGAQGIGMGLIESLNGSYANVVGLPICQVLSDLEVKFKVSARDHGQSRKREK